MFKYFILLIILFQAACTSVVWNGGIYDADRAIDTHTIVHTTQSDQLYAFGHLPTATPNSSGSLFFVGKQYWYAIDAEIASTITAPFRAPLSRAYRISAPYTGHALKALPITITADGHFNSQYCLNYATQTPTEQQQLRQLGFQQQAQPQHWQQCYAITGTICTQPPSFTTNHHFIKNIPVQLTFQKNHTNIQFNKLALNVLLTPFAVTVDTVSGLTMLPILVISDWLD